MITAGEGPIPLEILARTDCMAIEEELLGLPVIGGALLQVDVPKPDSFMELAKRGLSVYDWRDAPQSRSFDGKTYVLMCAPTVRLRFDDLPASLIDLVYKAETEFADVATAAADWLGYSKP